MKMRNVIVMKMDASEVMMELFTNYLQTIYK